MKSESTFKANGWLTKGIPNMRLDSFEERGYFALFNTCIKEEWNNSLRPISGYMVDLHFTIMFLLINEMFLREFKDNFISLVSGCFSIFCLMWEWSEISQNFNIISVEFGTHRGSLIVEENLMSINNSSG